MKFKLLEQIVTSAAYQLKESAAYSGSWSDGGCDSLLNRLKEYQDKLVRKLDLRPSEFSKLKDIDVGEPEEFSKFINKYKLSNKIDDSNDVIFNKAIKHVQDTYSEHNLGIPYMLLGDVADIITLITGKECDINTLIKYGK